MTQWILKLTDGSVMLGDIEDTSAMLIEMKDPSLLIKNNSGFEEKRAFPGMFTMHTDAIYIERTAIVYWAKPKSNFK